MTILVGPSPDVELYHLGGPADSVALVCAPYAGGGTAMFRSWPKSLPSVDFYGLSLPGREARFAEPPFATLDALVASAVEAMRPLAGACVYRKPRHGRSGDGVRPGWHAN
jgi:hypothetical protein